MLKNRSRQALGWLFGSLCWSAGVLAEPVAKPEAAAHVMPVAEPIFAKVNDQVIYAGEYEQALVNAQRQKFYHGKPPEDQILALYREVAEAQVRRVLLLKEALKRGVQPDEQAIATQVDSYDKRYADNPNWKQSRALMLPALTERLREQGRLAQLEAEVRRLAAPTDAEVRAFYTANAALFTEPEKIKLSTILLKVDPSSTSAVWLKAREDAAAIRQRLLAGADFAEQARLHSGDETAARGGDMGYLHRGMLTPEVHVQIDGMQVGQLSEPIQALEGIFLLRLEDRILPKVMPFDLVSSRAADLFLRDRADTAWSAFLADLRAKATVQFNLERYPYLGDDVVKAH